MYIVRHLCTFLVLIINSSILRTADTKLPYQDDFHNFFVRDCSWNSWYIDPQLSEVRLSDTHMEECKQYLQKIDKQSNHKNYPDATCYSSNYHEENTPYRLDALGYHDKLMLVKFREKDQVASADLYPSHARNEWINDYVHHKHFNRKRKSPITACSTLVTYTPDNNGDAHEHIVTGHADGYFIYSNAKTREESLTTDYTNDYFEGQSNTQSPITCVAISSPQLVDRRFVNRVNKYYTIQAGKDISAQAGKDISASTVMHKVLVACATSDNKIIISVPCLDKSGTGGRDNCGVKTYDFKISGTIEKLVFFKSMLIAKNTDGAVRCFVPCAQKDIPFIQVNNISLEQTALIHSAIQAKKENKALSQETAFGLRELQLSPFMNENLGLYKTYKVSVPYCAQLCHYLTHCKNISELFQNEFRRASRRNIDVNLSYKDVNRFLISAFLQGIAVEYKERFKQIFETSPSKLGLDHNHPWIAVGKHFNALFKNMIFQDVEKSSEKENAGVKEVYLHSSKKLSVSTIIIEDHLVDIFETT